MAEAVQLGVAEAGGGDGVVEPEDIAEACYFFAADTSSKSTGNIINVDAGNVQAFTR